jgi:putative transcriptional regulator
VRKRLRNRVADVRRARGWSQRELGRRSGLSRQTISAIESGSERNQPRADVMVRLAEVFEVEMADLFWTETEEAPSAA